jgi:hypothetical protein
MIIKSRDFSPSSQGWAVWHQSSPATNGYLDTTGNFLNSEYTSFIDATPTNSVFSVKCNSGVSSGNRYRTYGNSHNYIAYCWHDVPGLQKFGSYESNSSGVFVELGFKPAILVVKNIDATLTNSQWNVIDTKRDTYNPSLNNLAWDRNNNEPAVNAISYGIDILSNGFHIPSGNTGEAINNATATQTYIYMAWAEAPSVNLYGGQSNAH